MSKLYTIQDLEHSETALRMKINNKIPPKLLPNALLTLTTLNFIATSGPVKKFILSSGFRCPQVNGLVNGSETSDHMQALAMDIVTYTREDKCKLIQFILQKVNYDQIILESSWIHLGVRIGARRQILDQRYNILTVNELLKRI